MMMVQPIFVILFVFTFGDNPEGILLEKEFLTVDECINAGKNHLLDLSQSNIFEYMNDLNSIKVFCLPRAPGILA